MYFFLWTNWKKKHINLPQIFNTHCSECPESCLLLSVHIILPVIPRPPFVVVWTCSVGGVADHSQMVWSSSNRMKSCVLTVLASENIFSLFGGKIRWENSDDTRPVSPSSVRPCYHCSAPFPLLGSPWQQGNDKRSQKINRWRIHNTERKMPEPLPLRLVADFSFNSEREQNKSLGPH